jgi:FAD/FMN-containing dehydrogenase
VRPARAGGPHAFKYGVTGAWVTGLEAVVAPGELISIGGPIRKDVAGYDLKSLLVGSEGTLGLVTAAWLRLLPAPEAVLPIVAFYSDVEDGCDAIERVVGSGLRVAALEYLDVGTLVAAGPAYPGGAPAGAGFVVLAEADGSRAAAAALRTEVVEVLGEGSLALEVPEGAAVAELWRWRDGVSFAVRGRLGGKVSDDVVVPIDRLRDIVGGTIELGRRHGVEACSWGHAGDGNVHSSFLVSPGDADGLARAEAAADDLFGLALALGGSISGEHGTGWVKRGKLERQWSARAVALHRATKRAWDPKGLLNPGKKT